LYAPFVLQRLQGGITTYFYATGGLIFWNDGNGRRWGMVGNFPVPTAQPAPQIAPARQATREPMSFKDTIERCVILVRAETTAMGFNSNFNAYANGNRAHYYGKTREHFSFEKCMSENGYHLGD
jgi:hypothetical protein